MHAASLNYEKRDQAMRRRLHAAQVIGAFLFAAGVTLASPAFAQSASSTDVSDLRYRVQHLEHELQDVQQEVYRNERHGGGGDNQNAGPPPAGTAPLTQRINDIEASLRTVTGQLEELTHRMNDLSQKLDRLQNDMNYRFGNQQGGMQGDTGGGGNEMPMSDNSAAPAPQQLAPGPSNLGTVPESAVTNVPQPRPAPTQSGAPATGGRVVLKPPPSSGAPASGGDASANFNMAMDLLAHGQYDQARTAFRAVADQYPGHALAPEALYWSGDISYSAKKDYGMAARSFAELLKKYPKAPHAPDGMLKLGESLLGLGQKQEGCATLAAFPAKYPAANKALLAKARASQKKAACK
jgi:tol-pal system protein YbgF